MPTQADIRDALRKMAAQRAPKSFCPSEVARALSDNWRPLMPEVRRVAGQMREIIASQKGVLVDPDTARGPIRLSLKPHEPG